MEMCVRNAPVDRSSRSHQDHRYSAASVALRWTETAVCPFAQVTSFVKYHDEQAVAAKGLSLDHRLQILLKPMIGQTQTFRVAAGRTLAGSRVRVSVVEQIGDNERVLRQMPALPVHGKLLKRDDLLALTLARRPLVFQYSLVVGKRVVPLGVEALVVTYITCAGQILGVGFPGLAVLGQEAGNVFTGHRAPENIR